MGMERDAVWRKEWKDRGTKAGKRRWKRDLQREGRPNGRNREKPPDGVGSLTFPKRNACRKKGLMCNETLH